MGTCEWDRLGTIYQPWLSGNRCAGFQRCRISNQVARIKGMAPASKAVLYSISGSPTESRTEISSVYCSTPVTQVAGDRNWGMDRTLCSNTGRTRMEQCPPSFLKHAWRSPSKQKQLCHPEAFQSLWRVLGIFPKSCSFRGVGESGNKLPTWGLTSGCVSAWGLEMAKV